MQSMKGLELSRQYYEVYGRAMIREQFPEYENRIAVGLAGEGSQCLGYDDEISRDHDFEPGFCLWLTKEDERAIGFPLSRAYQKLPQEFSGIQRKKQSLFGGGRYGVLEIGEFYARFTGSAGAPKTLEQWLYLPEYALASAVSGQVFRDDLGEFSKIRTCLQQGYPEDVRRKKIAARAVTMAQSGQYNYGRCKVHGEPGAAALALGEFVKATVSMVFLLNNRYTPFYKWMFRGMRELPVLGEMAEKLEQLLSTEEKKRAGEQEREIEEICVLVAEELRRQGLSHGTWDYLEPHGVAVMEQIRDGKIRSLHIMEG